MSFRVSHWGWGDRLSTPQVQRLLLHEPWLHRRKKDCTPALFLTSSVSTSAISLCTSEEEGLAPSPHNAGKYFGGGGTGPPPHILEDFSPFLKCDLELRAVPLVLIVLKPVEIPQSQFLDNVVDMPGVVSGADVQTALNTRGDSTGAVLGQVVHARCCVWCGWPDSAEHAWRFHRCRSWTSCSCTLLCLVPMARQRRTSVEIPQVPFLDKLFMHVVVSGADGQTALNTRRDSTGAVLGQVVHARCCVWCRWPDSAEHAWRFHRCRSWTSCSCPLLCLVPMARQRRTPVEIPQVPFLDKLFMHVVVSGADGQTALNTRGDSTGAVLGQVVHARCCVWCGWPDSAEHPWRFHRCRSWTSCSCTLLCLVPMARQRRTPVEIPKVPFFDKLFMHVVVSGADGQTALNTRGDSTGAVLGQVVHARCCVWCRWPDSAEHPWRFHRSWTSCSCPLLCLVPMSLHGNSSV